VIRDNDVAPLASRHRRTLVNRGVRDGKMVALGGVVKTAVLIAIAVGLAGCFYVDPINQRPSLDIRANDEPVYRGDTVKYAAVVYDADDRAVDVTWRAYMCTDTTINDCDATVAFSGTEPELEFTVPRVRADGTTPVSSMKIVLDGRDDRGATAKPNDQITPAVLDRAPSLELRDTSIYKQDSPGPAYVVGLPIELYAVYRDADDALEALTIAWKVYPPSAVAVELTELAAPQVGKRLRPTAIGTWTVEVTITDPLGNATQRSVVLNVVADRAPCLAIVEPAVPPTSAVLPVFEPRLFQVTSVSDDLDSYPATTGGAEFGEPAFVWSIATPGNPRTVIGGATGSSTPFDPAVHPPGTIVELRVEIQDRKRVPVSCNDGEPTCSTSGTSCLQRQTWRVEAR
jgi:hypothetical protein